MPPARQRYCVTPLIFTKTLSRCQRRVGKDRFRSTRFLQISAANIRPNLPHQNRTDSCAYSNAALVQQVLQIAKRRWVADTKHGRQTNDLQAGFEMAKGAAICHPARRGERLVDISKFSSDSAKHGFDVLTVLPGFVATQMTEGMDLPARLTAQPPEVAVSIARGVARKRDVVYVRPIWRVIMIIIRPIPERVFKGMMI
jgi:hypothetical protein